LDARILFSRLKVADLLDEVGQGKRKNIERHHLFPKAYLKGIGISNFREVTQTGNLALIEWKDNAKFKDSPPSEYYPKSKVSLAMRNGGIFIIGMVYRTVGRR
jgi:hypothetical protein